MRITTFGGPVGVWCSAAALPLSPPVPPPVCSMADSTSVEPQTMISVEVNCDRLSVSCRHVATESDSTSDVSESRPAESDS